MAHVGADATVYAHQIGTGFMKTSEKILSWHVLNNSFGRAYMLHLAVDSENAKLLYAITSNQRTHTQAIVTSPDGGKTWKVLGTK
jgi:hypothetical protein